MLNHVRTLLLNLDYVGNATEHIPNSYISITLPNELARVYNILFPRGVTRLYKLFLVQNYLNIIKAANLDYELLKFDPRISYSDDPNFFKINRVTNPIVSNPDYPIHVLGKYETNAINQNYYDNFLISQVPDVLGVPQVNVFSKVRNVYIKGDKTLEESGVDTWTHLDFTDSPVSKPIYINAGDIHFIIGNYNNDFCNSYNKTWEFIVEAPYVFEFNKIFDALANTEITDSLFNYRPDVDVTNYENYWKLHYNPVYRLAGLLIALAKKINTLI